MRVRFNSRSAYMQLMVEGLAQRRCRIAVTLEAAQDAAEQSEQEAKLTMVLLVRAADEGPNDAFGLGESAGTNVLPRLGRSLSGQWPLRSQFADPANIAHPDGVRLDL